jgi:amino acid permease
MSGWVVFLKGRWVTSTFVTNYLALIMFPLLYVGARLYYQEGPKKPHEMDYVTNIPEIEAETYVPRIIYILTRLIFHLDMMNLLQEMRRRLSGNGW